MSVLAIENTEDVSVFLFKAVKHAEFENHNESEGLESRLHLGGCFISVEPFSHRAGSTLPGEERPVPQQQGTKAAFKDNIP